VLDAFHALVELPGGRGRHLTIGILFATFLLSLASLGDKSATPDVSEIARRENEASQRRAEAKCQSAVSLLDGSVAVAATDYVHSVKRDGRYVKEAIPGLDRVVSQAPELGFTLDYPFEKPFAGKVTGPLTLRRIIDAVRAGFRTMYQGTTESEIPGLYNKDVRGAYGRAFHIIGDLFIEQIQLCDGKTLEIEIGS
jgi:hypothetical protein